MKTKVVLLSLFLVFLSFQYDGECQSQFADSIPSLKDVFKENFYMGTSISDEQITSKDTRALHIILSQFNSVTPENCLKWETVHPRPGEYDFKQADRFVDFAERNGKHITGHILLDRVQTPAWVFEDSDGNTVSRDTLLHRIREHITTVVGRYKGRINVWHVVNEAIGIDGKLRKCKWLDIIGEDYIEKAFEYAHEADPEVLLYYNGHDMLTMEATTSVAELVKTIKSRGLRIDGIGVQAHWSLDYPSLNQIDEGIAMLAKSGLNIALTEMDITVLRDNENPYPDELPDSVQQKLSERYGDLFTIFCKHADVISRINFWGIDDGQSWLNYYPIKGRTDYPLLFDRSYKPKPAFFSVIKTKCK